MMAAVTLTMGAARAASPGRGDAAAAPRAPRGRARPPPRPFFPRLEKDDHNNPSLVFWRGRLWAFVSPHSGHIFPRNRRMFLHYRKSRHAYGLTPGFTKVHSISLPKGCGLG